MVTCQVAKERNVQRDVSYFKTSSPGESTQAHRRARRSDPIKVLLFFPRANEVKEQVRDYFDALASASGHMQIEEHDRFVDAELAGKYKVTKDGVIVLVQGTGDKEKSQTIEVDTDIEKARKGASKLRNFDREVNSQLMKLVREKRKAYVMTGHGEITDPDSVPPELKGRVPERRTTVFKKRLGDLNYEVKDLGLIDLAKDVPDDATIVIMLAPTVPLQPAEWAALVALPRQGRPPDDRARSEGGSEPRRARGQARRQVQPGAADRRPGVPAAARQRRRIAGSRSRRSSRRTRRRRRCRARSTRASSLIDSGALEDAPFTAKGEQPKKTMTIRSMESSFLDLNDNFSFDAATEKRQKWNIGAAIEGPKLKDADGKDKDGFRVARVRRRRPVRRRARLELDGPRGGRDRVGSAARRLGEVARR